jgi:hypothetical protein
MARPEPEEVQSGTRAWDATVNDNFAKVFDIPFGIAEHAGDETDIEAAFPAASYSNCLLWVEHSVSGWALYRSDGAVWALFSAGGGGGGIAPNTPITIAASDETTVLMTGTAVTTFRMPGPFAVTKVRASLTTASTSGEVEVDVKINGVSMFTTTLTIDQDEETSETAAVAAVLTADPVEIDDDDEITIDIVDAGTGAVGLKVSLEGALDPEDVAGEPNYTTTEQLTLQTWTDDAPIYKKTVAIASLPNATGGNTAHGITGLDVLVDIKGVATNGTRRLPLPYVHSGTDLIMMEVDGTNIVITTAADYSTWTGHVTLYYTK